MSNVLVLNYPQGGAAMSRDRVERTIDDMHATREDLDTQPAEVVLRVLLLGQRLEQRIGESLEPFGLQVWEFEVLVALRRQESPYRLACSDLARQVVITNSGITHRVSRLVERGLVSRGRDATDRRAVFVELTTDGYELVEAAIRRRTEDSAALVSDLAEDERAALVSLLRRLNEAVGGD